MRNVHTWKEVTEEGEKREVRASKFSKEWKFQSKLRHEEIWTYHDVPSIADLEALHDILYRKYQRKRLSYDDVVTVENMLKERRKDEPAQPEKDSSDQPDSTDPSEENDWD